MIEKLLSTINWLPSWLAREAQRNLDGTARITPAHIYLCVCDHYEPYWNRADHKTARGRIQQWLDHYPKIAEQYRDSNGNILKWSFFYPEEEYRADDLHELAGLCHAGFGEVEIHLHHDNDTSENLRHTLIDYKKRLHETHGLLSRSAAGEIVYGFIHGNWALCNSRPDGRWCGVNDEINILLETGCYADFTLPSAPSATQTRTVNSIYYATDKPGRSKSHDSGIAAEAGKKGEGLLMVQGPLCLNWNNRKFGLFPRIENGGLFGNNPPTPARVKSWIDTGISVKGAPGHVFVKIYTHGANDDVMKMLFDNGGLSRLFESFEQYRETATLHYVSAREMVEKIVEIQGGNTNPTSR